MKAGFLKKIPSRSVIHQAMYYGAFLLLISLGLGGIDMYGPPVLAVQDRASSQKEPQIKPPQIIEVLPYSKDGIQKLLTLWCVEVPYSDQAVVPFYEQLHSFANRALILTESKIGRRNDQQILYVAYYYDNNWPYERWFGNLAWDNQTNEVYILMFRTRTYRVRLTLDKVDLNKVQPLGSFPLIFDPQKFQEWPKVKDPLLVTEERQFLGSRGYSFRQISTVLRPPYLCICAERIEPGEPPTFLRFDLRSKELTEVTFQNKPDKPDLSKSEK